MLKEKALHLIIRVLAKGVDFFLVLAVGLVIMRFGFDLLALNGTVLSFGISVMWMLGEAISIYFFGYTPGKKLLALALLNLDGNKLNFAELLKRALFQFVLGFGLGIPLVILFAWAINIVYYVLVGMTTYDRLLGFDIRLEEVRKPRIAIIASALLIIVAMAIVVSDDIPNVNSHSPLSFPKQ